MIICVAILIMLFPGVSPLHVRGMIPGESKFVRALLCGLTCREWCSGYHTNRIQGVPLQTRR